MGQALFLCEGEAVGGFRIRVTERSGHLDHSSMKRNYEKTLPAKVPLFFFIGQPTQERQLGAIPHTAKDARFRIREQFVGASVIELLARRASTLFACYYGHPCSPSALGSY